MKYVFVCADISFLTLQYRDFEIKENLKLVKTPGKMRLIMKALNVAGFYKLKLLDFMAVHYFKKCFLNVPVGSSEDTYCFILYSRTYEDFRSTLVRYLRETYKRCKIVVYYGDITLRHLCHIEDVKKEADLVCSFDSDEAKKWGVEWVLEPFSQSIAHMEALSPHKNPIKWDVTFVGQAKDRFKKIIAIYEKMTAIGLRCDFHITGVAKRDQVYTDKIAYAPLSFTELLKHVVQSKCILEIMQGNGVSPTTRYTEAMLFERNLLTDCKAFCEKDRLSPNIIYYEKPADLSAKVLKEAVCLRPFDKSKYIELFSIDAFIRTIQKLLNSTK